MTIQEVREAAQREAQVAEMQRLASQANRSGRMTQGRGDARNFSYGQMPPPDHNANRLATEDLRRLNRAGRNPSHPSGSSAFGPSNVLGGRTNSNRARNMGPGGNLLSHREDSGNSSRTGTPPAGKDKKEDPTNGPSTNAFR